MKHLLLALLLVSFSSALADTPAKIAEDYRKASAAALVGVLVASVLPSLAGLAVTASVLAALLFMGVVCLRGAPQPPSASNSARCRMAATSSSALPDVSSTW